MTAIPMRTWFCKFCIVIILALAPIVARAQWVQTNGPYGGWVFCIATLGSDIFIGSEGGVFESTDSGSSWQKRSNGLAGTSSYYSMTTFGSHLFLETQTQLYRSTDSGATWNLASTLPRLFRFYPLASDSRCLFLLDASNTYISSDEGSTWGLADTSITMFSQPLSVLAVDSTTFFAGEWVTKTTNEGANWAVLAIPPPRTTWDIVSMAHLGNILFDLNGTVYRSMDGGQTWIVSDSTVPYHYATFLATSGQMIFEGTPYGIFRSIDSGMTWESFSTGLPNGAQPACFSSVGSELLVGYEGLGMFRSFDSGQTWSPCDNGIINISVNTIASTNDTIWAGTNAGVFLSADNGSTWVSRRFGMTNYDVLSILANNQELIAGTQGGTEYPSLFFSSDRGEIWYADSVIDGYNFTTLIQGGPNYIAGGVPYTQSAYGFFTSTNAGSAWEECNVVAGYTGIVVNAIVNVGSTLLAATNAYVYRSDDDGITWKASLSGLDFGTRVNVLTIGSAGSKVYVYCTPSESSSIFVSSDTGNSWIPAEDSIFPSRGRVTGFASAGNNMFAATDSMGIYLTTDFGAHWIDESLGLGDSDVISLAVQGNELLAGTASSGVWRRPLAEMIADYSVRSPSSTQDSIAVFPNPSGDNVTILCPSLTGAVSASLVSVSGATAWQKTLSMNGQPIEIDCSGVPNGVYWLELKSVSTNGSKACKIVLDR